MSATERDMRFITGLEVCPRCGAKGPWKFVMYNAAGAIVECAAFYGIGPCGRRIQVDLS